MTATSPAALWANRIVRSATVSPAELRANPLNYRRHPAHQRAALREMLDTVGWVQQVVVNERSGNLVDGHLRVDLAETEGVDVPVLYVDLSDEEERIVLAALDPIAALADVDSTALAELIADVSIEGDTLMALLGELAAPPPDAPPARAAAEYLEAMKVSLADPEHAVEKGEVWRVGDSHLACVSVYDGWVTYGPLLTAGALLVPYPTPIVALTARARATRTVMVQPDQWLAGHLLDKFAQVYGEDAIEAP
jgi:hypothetical protein